MSHALRPELLNAGPLPARIARLPVDARGYPVPWFVAWLDGVPEFRAMDPVKWRRAVREQVCWVCGGTLGKHLAFVVGPMCVVNRTTSEPPCHRDCAEWSARCCPFLSRPHMVRRTDADTPTVAEASAGFALARNPGVAAVYLTRSYEVFAPQLVTAQANAGLLIEMGAPTDVLWFAEGRDATRAEVEQSLAGGLPALADMAAQDPDPGGARRALDAWLARAQLWLPL